MSTLSEILESHGKEIVFQIRKNLSDTRTNATLETSNSVRYEVKTSTNVSLTVIGGRKFFPSVETGSKPAKTTVPSKEMVESLTEWAQAKGVTVSPYGAAVNILKKGSKLYQQGGRTNIYTDMTPEVVDAVKEDVTQFFSDSIKDKISQVFSKSVFA